MPEITREAETKRDRIERLKKNEFVYSRLSQEDKNLLAEVGKTNMVYWTHNRQWKQPSLACDQIAVCRIKEDYQVEDVVKCEVFEKYGKLMYTDPGGADRNLTVALMKPSFMYYEYEDEVTIIDARAHSGDESGEPAEYPKYVVLKKTP